jgi:hypothetical protein
MRRFQFFTSMYKIMFKSTLFQHVLVLGGLTLGRNHLLDPAGHGVA